MTDYQTIMVNGKIACVWDGRTAHCKKCNTAIGWGITTNNKRMPFDLVQLDPTKPRYEAHWANCPNRDDFRRVEKPKQSEGLHDR